MQQTRASRYQVRDMLFALSKLARLIVPTAFMLQDITADVTSRGLCLLMYWLGVGCMLLVERWAQPARHNDAGKMSLTDFQFMVQESGFLVLCAIAALRSTARAQQPLVVLVLLAQVLHRQGAVWPNILANMTRAVQGVAQFVVITVALVAAAQLKELYRVSLFAHAVSDKQTTDDRLPAAMYMAFATGVLARDMQWVERQKGNKPLAHLLVQIFLFLAQACVSALAVFQVLPFDALREPLKARHHGLSEEAAGALRTLLQTLCAAILLAPLPRWSGSWVYNKLLAQAFVLIFFTLLASAASDEAALLLAALIQLGTTLALLWVAWRPDVIKN